MEEERDNQNYREMLVKGVEAWLASLAKTLTATGVVLSAVWYLTAPLIQPYLSVPDKLDEVRVEINALDVKFSQHRQLEFISFQGVGIILNQTDTNLELVYSVHRKISCDTTVQVRFWNVDKGYYAHTYEMPALKSPVASGFIPWKVSIHLPEELEPGRYTYIPRMVPVDCGVYDSVSVPPSDIFEIPVKTDVVDGIR